MARKRRRRKASTHGSALGIFLGGMLFALLIVSVALYLHRHPEAWPLPERKVLRHWLDRHLRPEPGQRQETLRVTSRGDGGPFFAGAPRAWRADAEHVLLENTGFSVGYSETRKNPLWVAYRVFYVARTPDPPRPGGFQRDTRTRAGVVSGHYTRSGFDRGHLAPNDIISDLYGREAQLQTFLMSNVSPQLPAFNRGIWLRLERMQAREWLRKLEAFWVITGPIFDPRIQRLRSGVEVPDRFYKITIDEVPGAGAGLPGAGVRVIAWDLPQEAPADAPLEAYLVSVDWIEKETGLDFLHELEDIQEDAVEAMVTEAMW